MHHLVVLHRQVVPRALQVRHLQIWSNIYMHDADASRKVMQQKLDMAGRRVQVLTCMK